MKLQVVGLGALNMDYLYRVERILVDGEAVVDEASAYPGGSAANTVYGLAKLGVSTGFVGAVGDDSDGELLLNDFKKVGADTSRIKAKRGAKSGAVLCLSDTSGKRSLYVVPGANNYLTMADLDPAYVNQAAILHISSFAGDSQFQITLELMGKLDASVKVSFSPGMLWIAKGMKALHPILSRSKVLFVNGGELERLTSKDIVPGAAACLKVGCQIVVVTLGSGTKLTLTNGKTVTAVAYMRNVTHEDIVAPTEGPAAVDTTGAGDAFAAGFLYGLLNNKELEECGRLGHIAARFCIEKVGARPGLPTLSELTKRYQQLYSATV